MSKLLINSIFICILSILFTSIDSKILVKADNEINFSCDRNIYYILIDVIFANKPPKLYYPFNLMIFSSEVIDFKCMLDYPKKKIYCFHSFSDELDYIKKDEHFQFPYPFPELDDIEWDYDTFLKNVYLRVWDSKSDCGNENIYNVTDKNYKKWDLEGSLSNLENGQCVTASISKEDFHKYYFDMVLSLEGGEIYEQFQKNPNTTIKLMQDIWVPLLPQEDEDDELLDEFFFAYCSNPRIINKKNYDNIKLNCYIPIDLDLIFNGEIRIGPFFDKIYIRNGKKIEIITTYIKINETNGKTFASLGDQESGIICPNQPFFTIESKDDITMGLFENETNEYTFFLTGTLSNGYYSFKNGTVVELIETYKDINFSLVVKDNFIDSDENEVNVSCLLPKGTPYNEESLAIIKCKGIKEQKSVQNNNIDIVLNWKIKENNNFNNIIINWPDDHDDIKKKNIYGYKLTGLSIRQSNFGCHNNKFDFYAYIYDLGSEPKLSFELPLSNPKNLIADCELFDRTALKCSINLKHKKLSKGTKVTLPPLGSENIIDTEEGNRIIFTMNNFTQINNDHDFYVETKEECGDYLVVGTLKDLGISHKTSVVLYILIIIFFTIILAGVIVYLLYKVGIYYKRGKKLTASEETKDSNSTIGGRVIK